MTTNNKHSIGIATVFDRIIIRDRTAPGDRIGYIEQVIDHNGLKFNVLVDRAYSEKGLSLFKQHIVPLLDIATAPLEKEQTELKAENARLRRELGLNNNSYSYLQSLYFASRKREDEKQKTIVERAAEIDRLEKEGKALRAEIVRLTNENEQLKREANPTLVTEFLKCRNREIREVSEKRLERIKQLQADNSTLQITSSRRCERIKQLEAALEAHSMQERKLTLDVETLQREVNACEGCGCKEREAKLVAAETANKDLRDALLTARTKLKVLANQADRYYESTTAKCKEHNAIP